MAFPARKAAAPHNEKPDAFEAARLAMQGQLSNERLCEILLVGRCKKRFLQRQSENGRGIPPEPPRRR